MKVAPHVLKEWLRHDVGHDMPMHIGQPKIPSAIAVGEFQVVDAEKVENGGVEIVPGGAMKGRFPADVVRAAVGNAVFEPGSRPPNREAVLIVIAPRTDHVGLGLRERRSAGPGRAQEQRGRGAPSAPRLPPTTAAGAWREAVGPATRGA